MAEDIIIGINRIFNHEKLRKYLTWIRYPITGGLFLILLFHAKTVLLLPGFMISLFGEIIQLWSLGALRKNQELCTRGPYSLTRNPMYLGRFFVIEGIILTTGIIWIILMFIPLYWFYAINRVKREEQLLSNIFGKEYGDYCKRVKRFSVNFKNVGLKSILYFRLDCFVDNHGHLNLVLLSLCYVILWSFCYG